MVETINNISHLFGENNFKGLTFYTLSFTPNGNNNTNINNDKIKKLMDDEFDSVKFPEYKEIAYDVYNFVVNNKLIMKTPTVFQIVSNNKVLTKGHVDPYDSNGYVKLFSIVFMNDETINLVTITVNMDLLKPKVNLQNDVKTNDIKLEDKDQKEMDLKNLQNCIDSIDKSDLSANEFINLCMDALKLNNDDVKAYNDIIFDMNQDASELFAEISYINSKEEKGIFVYYYESPTEFITHVIDKTNPSIVEWAPVEAFKDTAIEDIVNDKVKLIKNLTEEYIVLIMIGNICSAQILNKNTKHIYGKINQDDLKCSLLKCMRSRTYGNKDAPNREYDWARKKLDKLNKVKK